MMRFPIRLTILRIMIIILSCIGTIHAADLKDSFMGIKWQSDLSASPDFVRISEQDQISNFIKPSVIHTAGDVKIYPVVYSSFGNQFFAVYFQNDVIIFSRLRNYFNEKYGSSVTTTQLNPRRSTNTWTHHNVEITLKLNRETGKLTLSYYYMPLAEEVNKIRLEAYQETTRRFLDRIDREGAAEIKDMLMP